jgi:ATP-dependent Clp protease ATP-binding subunit ClpC
VREISRDSRVGFSANPGLMNSGEIEAAALSELRRLFNPEFINRVDDVIVFGSLSQKEIEVILDLQLAALSARLAEQGFSIIVNKAARRILIEKGWDPKCGGRPLRRAVQKELEDPLSTMILEKDQSSGGTVFVAEGKNGIIKLKAGNRKQTLARSGTAHLTESAAQRSADSPAPEKIVPQPEPIERRIPSLKA